MRFIQIFDESVKSLEDQVEGRIILIYSVERKDCLGEDCLANLIKSKVILSQMEKDDRIEVLKSVNIV